jgi:bacterioferritin
MAKENHCAASDALNQHNHRRFHMAVAKKSPVAAKGTDSKEARRKKVLEVLNAARAMELYAISQYMNQHYTLDDMDYGLLAANLKLIGIDEMRHAEMFAERIKELGGEPTATPDGEVKKRQDVRAVFPFDTNLEDDTVDAYNRFLLICRENGDNISANLLETIIVEEQAHLNYFDNVASHIKNLGDSYLSKIAGTPAETGGTTKGFVIGPVTPDATA